MGYFPVGDVPDYPSTHTAVGLVAAPSTNAYTQTYATAAATLPAMTAAAIASAVADTPVAGGTGAQAGCWDTAGHRDTARTTLNEMKTLAESLKVAHTALLADVLQLKKNITALIDDLQAWKFVA